MIIYRTSFALTSRENRLPRSKEATRPKGRGAGAAGRPSGQRVILDAIDRARDWLAERHDYHGYLSRRDSGRGAPELARHLRGDLLAKQGRDGSWGEGGLLESAEALWQLLELGQPAGSAPVARALDWLLGRRDQEGTFSSGCTPARHEQRICEHYVQGLFSPGPADESQEAALSNGQTVTSDAGARLLASERALRSILWADPSDPRAAASVIGLRSLPLYVEYGGTFTPALLVGAVQALARAGPSAASELAAGLEALAGAQADDGTWPNVEFFFVLETLLELKHPLAEQMLARAVPRLLEIQHKYGAWGRRHLAAQTWIAVQVLEQVAMDGVIARRRRISP